MTQQTTSGNAAKNGLQIVATGSAGTWSVADQQAFYTAIAGVVPSVDNGVIIFHSQSFDKPDKVEHVVIVDSIDVAQHKVNIIEAQGYDDEKKDHTHADGNPGFHDSAEKVVRHEYVEQYLSPINSGNGKSYVGRWWIAKFVQ